MVQSSPIPDGIPASKVPTTSLIKAIDPLLSQPTTTLHTLTSPASPEVSIPVAISSKALALANYLLQNNSGEETDTSVGKASEILNSEMRVQDVADSLAQSLSKSGLFYESHLGQWIEGQRTLDQIKQEPQNNSGTDQSVLTAKQLDIYDQKTVTWTGPVWSGQTMTWTTWLNSEENQSEHKESRQASKINPPTVHSHLVMTLPNLGMLNVRFTLRDQRLLIKLGVSSSKASARIESRLGELASALARSGQLLDGLVLEQSNSQP